jgi:glucose dehydrogenase
MGVPSLGGPLTTAGGVAFLTGTADYFIRAYDVRNGEQLWQDRLPAGAQSTPMSNDVDGTQFVVTAAGGHGSFGTKICARAVIVQATHGSSERSYPLRSRSAAPFRCPPSSRHLELKR